MSDIMLLYFMLINIAGFLLMFYDKKSAKKQKHRVPEKKLMGIAVAGGSLGTYAAMQVCRHKTKTALFSLGVPAIIILQLVFLLYCNLKF